MKKTFFSALIILLSLLTCFVNVKPVSASQMPFYNLQPKKLVVRSQFFTNYKNSAEERKWNISLAVKSLNNTFVDVNKEFSFNNCVGERNEKNGYLPAKIINKGEFTEGYGGGVCQVSSTLYNAVLLAGLKITEVHPHSLPVNYVLPSFDAMVNYYSADLKFINDTKNPVIIKASADGEKIKISLIGEKSYYTYNVESEITEEIPAPDYEIIKDYNNEYNLSEGEKLFLSYSKRGLKSKGYLIKKKGNKIIEKKLIRKNTYSAQKGRVIIGVLAENTQNIN